MKKVIEYIRCFIKEDFHPGFYLYTLVFLVITITFNYIYDFEDTYLDSTYGTRWGLVSYFLFYAVAYYSIALPQAYFRKADFYKSSIFWIKSLAFLFILSLHVSFDYHGPWIRAWGKYNSAEYRYLYKVVNNIYPIFIYLILLGIMKIIYDRKTNDGLYGLTFKRFDPVPYFVFLLLMTPLIFIVSFQSDFLKTYPQLKPWEFQGIFNLSDGVLFSIFEVFYLIDFIWVEILFRGAMVIGLVAVMGRHSILPMVVTYAFLHYGKPLGETIGSVLGGYILGIIALYSRSILGGVAIHMGVALLMELMALMQHYLFNRES